MVRSCRLEHQDDCDMQTIQLSNADIQPGWVSSTTADISCWPRTALILDLSLRVGTVRVVTLDTPRQEESSYCLQWWIIRQTGASLPWDVHLPSLSVRLDWRSSWVSSLKWGVQKQQSSIDVWHFGLLADCEIKVDASDYWGNSDKVVNVYRVLRNLLLMCMKIYPLCLWISTSCGH